MNRIKLVLALSLGGCSGADPDFCGRLAEAPDCSGDAESLCRMAIDQQHAATPQCGSQLDALVDCVGDLPRVGCSGSRNAYASGDGLFSGPNNFALIGDASLVVNDSRCDVLKQSYDRCIGQ